MDCSSKHHPREGAHWLSVMCTFSETTSLSLSHYPLKGVAVNKEALEVNNCSWGNVLAGLPLCCWGHSVVPVS